MKTGILEKMTEVRESGGYFGATVTMSTGDSGWASAKSKDYMDYISNNVGKEFTYEFGTTSTGGGKVSKMALVNGEAPPSPPGGEKKPFKPFKSDYNSPERLAIDQARLEFERGAKQNGIAYSVALEQANKFLALKAGERVTVKDLLETADKIYDHQKQKTNGKTGNQSEE